MTVGKPDKHDLPLRGPASAHQQAQETMKMTAGAYFVSIPTRAGQGARNFLPICGARDRSGETNQARPI